MVSPVNTEVKHYSSLMPNAPVLNGTVGSMIALIEACGVTGFDTKTLTSLVVLAGVATYTFTGTHASTQDSVITVAGVTGGPTGFANHNGEQKVTGRPTATTGTFATTLPDGTYTGTITVKMAPFGLAKPFSGTNKAVFRFTDPLSTGMFLRIDDSNAQFARVIGYETMTDVDTGAGLFPTNAQLTGGGYWAKSTASNTTANQWALFADGRTMILHIAPGANANPSSVYGGATRGFGDLLPFRPGGDNYGCFLNCSSQTTSGTMHDGMLDGGSSSTTPRCYFPRDYHGLGVALPFVCFPYVGNVSATSGADITFSNFPSYIDGRLWMAKRFFATSSNVPVRGDLPGLYSVPQGQTYPAFTFGNVVDGSEALTGRRLFAINPTNTGMTQVATSSNVGSSFADITGPWR